MGKRWDTPAPTSTPRPCAPCRVPHCSPGATPIRRHGHHPGGRPGVPDTTPASRAAPPPCSKSCGRTGTAPPGIARPTSPQCTKSRPPDRSTGAARHGRRYFYGFFGPGVSQWYPPLWENTTPIRAPKRPEAGYHLEADTADQTAAFNRGNSRCIRQAVDCLLRPNGHKPPVGVPHAFIEKYRDTFETATTSCVSAFWRGRRRGNSRATRKLARRLSVLSAVGQLTDMDKQVGVRRTEVFDCVVEYIGSSDCRHR